MRVLHVIGALAPRYGGPSKACPEMAQAVARLGHDVAIYTTNLDGPGVLDLPVGRPLRQGSLSITYFPIQRPRFWDTSWPMGTALRRHVRDFDIVHIHSLYMFHDWIAPMLCRRFGVPYLICPHGSLDPYIYQRHRWRKSLIELAFQKRALRRCSAVHCMSEEEVRLAKPHVAGAPCVVVPLGLSPEEYASLPRGRLRARHPEVADRKIILFLGRLNFKKGLDLLSKAFGQIRRRRDDVQLVIVGPDDDMRRRVEQWLAEERALDRVTFTGLLLGEDKLGALADADLFVLPSYSENFGIAVIEAMACGVPVVISDKVNIWREVEAGGGGRVVATDVQALAEALHDLLADQSTARRMGGRARRQVEEKFNWHSIGPRLEAVYRAIIDGRQPAQAGENERLVARQA